MRIALRKLAFIVPLVILCSGCVLNNSIHKPTPSLFKYDSGGKSNTVIQIVDHRIDKRFFRGIGKLAFHPIKQKKVDDPIFWLAQALQNEFSAREMGVKVVTTAPKGKPDFVLSVKEYQIDNYCSSSFTPWVAYHYFKGELISSEIHPLRAYFLYGKVPVWSAEIPEPCLDMPMEIIVKEIVSKINSEALHYRVSNSRLKEIYNEAVMKMEANAADTYRPVLALGGSNNPAAMKMLVEISDSKDYLVRACSLSAMGILGAHDQIEFLKDRYKSDTDIHRVMALKSIGEIGTPEAIAFIKKAKEEPQNKDDYGIQYCADLFIEQ